MSTKTTKIEWTDKTWNPITGCTKRSAGCTHCYAEVLARRLKAMGLEKYRNGFGLTLHEDDIEEPLQRKKPHNIFVCSMRQRRHQAQQARQRQDAPRRRHPADAGEKGGVM